MSEFAPEALRPLAPLTTLGLGGSARHFVDVDRRDLLSEALRWAEARALKVGILGGGSNLVIRDEGFDGLVLRMRLRGVSREGERLTAQAGETWDDVVELAVREGLAGVECLSGIPGTVGATPIQNVGAYGQEVSDVIEAVEVFDRRSHAVSWLAPAQCGFSYRDSAFKRDPERFIVLSVRFALRADGRATVRYPELQRALAVDPARAVAPTLAEVRSAVRALRSQKGMLIEPGWEPSVGSFFTNPIVSDAEAERVAQIARARGQGDAMPRFAAGAGRVKLSAAWLVEGAGTHKGLARGGVGVSSRHALALVHRGAGSTRELLALATEIQQQVKGVYGIALAPEPVYW